MSRLAQKLRMFAGCIGALDKKLLIAATFREIVRRVFSDEVFYRLDFDLGALRGNEAKVDIDTRKGHPGIVKALCGAIAGQPQHFSDIKRAIEIALFAGYGIPDLYVGYTSDGRIGCLCWLINGRQNDQLRCYFGQGVQLLDNHEVLLEFIYTLPVHRGNGMMREITYALFRAARLAGFQRALAYVNSNNVSSLKGCNKIGWSICGVKVVKWRWFRKKISFRAPSGDDYRSYNCHKPS